MLEVAGLDLEQFRGGLIFKAHRLLYHSTPGLRVIKKKKRTWSQTRNESLSAATFGTTSLHRGLGYRGTSLIRNSPPPRTTVGP